MISASVKRWGGTAPTFAKVQAKLARKLPLALLAAADVLYQESQKLVPLDIEALADSGHAFIVTPGLNAEAAVGYGREGFVVWGHSRTEGNVFRQPAQYAVYVHEAYELLLKTAAPTGQSNFLREPLYTRHAEMRIALNMEMSR